MKWPIILYLLLNQSVFAQNDIYRIDSVYNTSTMLKDFDLFYELLVKVHPSPFDFISKVELDAIYKESRAKITDGKDSRMLELVSNLLVHIGCGHTVAIPSVNWYNYAKKNGKLISIAVKLIDDELYIWNQPFEDSISLRGSKIISINGLDSKNILSRMKDRIAGDGRSRTLPNHSIQKSFRTYFSFLEGFDSIHHITYFNINGDVDSIIIPANTRLPKMKTENKQYDKFSIIQQEESIRYCELKADKKIALIDIDAFERSKFKTFYKEAFKRLKLNSATDLIIDLRNNGGGYFPNGNEFLTYIFENDFYYRFSRPDNKLPKNKYLKMDPISKLTKALFRIIPDDQKKNQRKDYKIKYKVKKKNRFTGQIYVLINNGSFSMSGYVAAKLNTLKNVTFIGQETGGGEYGSNAILSYWLTLLNTNVRIKLPYYFSDHQISDLKKGNGIIPDIKVKYKISDYMAQEDIELNTALYQIEKRKLINEF